MKYAQSDMTHRPRDLSYRQPYGAMRCGETVELTVDVSDALRDAYIMLACEYEGVSKLSLMRRGDMRNGRHVFSAYVKMPKSSARLYYYFIINDCERLYYYCAGDSGLCEQHSGACFMITVYERDYQTPPWMKHSIMYHIFVDRFHRGAGRGGLDRADYHTSKGRRIIPHENWDEPPMYAPLPGERFYDPCDFYGGDLRGIIEKLPYLQSLGVGCLYLSPIFESNSNHKYNTSDYLRIDPMFGSEGDFTELCRRADEMGMRIMLDGVFSHTGDDSVYFNRYGRYDGVGAYQSALSPYAPWYNFYSHPTKYDCWWGFESLPNVNEMNPSYLDFIISGENSVIKHWLRAGAGGWRLDVADELPDEFIARMREAIKSENPQAALLGEVWEDAATKFSMGTNRKYVLGHELDSVMNYPFRDAVARFLLGRIDAFSAVDALESLREHYPIEFYYSCMNLISSHDVPRALSILGGYPDGDPSMSREVQSKYALNPEMRALGLKRMRLAMLFQMAMPGMPDVYYGDETGMEGLMDPFNRASFPWGREDAAFFGFACSVCNIRARSATLQTGRMVLFAPHPDAIVAVRFCADGLDAFGETVPEGEPRAYIAAFNRALRPVALNLDFSIAREGPDALKLPDLSGEYSDAFSSMRMLVSNNRAALELAPLCASLWVSSPGTPSPDPCQEKNFPWTPKCSAF